MTRSPTFDREDRPVPINVNGQVEAMIARGWYWSPDDADLLVHPQDHSLAVRVDRAAGTLRMSAALARALDLVIPTPPGRSKSYWRS
jgi:hypothetical protein